MSTVFGPQLPGPADLEAAHLHFARIEAEDAAWLAREFPHCRAYRQEARDTARALEDARTSDVMHSAARALAHHQTEAEPEAGQ